MGRRVLDVAEADESGGFAVAVAGAVEQVDGLAVAVDGLLVPSEVVVDVAEAVPDVGLSVEVRGLLGQTEGLTAVRQRLVVVAELGEDPPDVVQGGGLPGPVTGGPMVREAAVGVAESLPARPCASDIRDRCWWIRACPVWLPTSPNSSSARR